MSRTSLSLSCLTLAAILCAGCQRPHPVEEIGTGTRSGNTYSHEYFNFSITFPEGWYILSHQEQDEVMKTGQDALGDSPRLKAAARAAEANTLQLISAFEHPPGAFVDSNMNIIIAAERVAHAPAVRTGADYLAHTQKIFSEMALRPRVDPIERGQQVGPLTMDVLPVHLPLGMIEAHQRMYATRVGDYVLLIATTYMNDEERARLDEILQTVKPAR